MTLREHIEKARKEKKAIGHFNISNLEGLKGIFEAARSLDLPVIIGVSEGEREFIGVEEAVALVKSLRDEFKYPIFLNADHSYSYGKVVEAVDAGFDAVIFDGAQLPLEENINITKKCVEYVKKVNQEKGTDILVEGELGYIGSSSNVLNEIPTGISLDPAALTSSEDAKRFVAETGVDLFAPAVGNIHGMLRNMPDPALNLERIAEISEAVNIPLVLHGASGNSEADIHGAIKRGVSVVHINTELRVAYKYALKKSLDEDLGVVAPYKFAGPAIEAVKKVVIEKLKIFNS